MSKVFRSCPLPSSARPTGGTADAVASGFTRVELPSILPASHGAHHHAAVAKRLCGRGWLANLAPAISRTLNYLSDLSDPHPNHAHSGAIAFLFYWLSMVGGPTRCPIDRAGRATGWTFRYGQEQDPSAQNTARLCSLWWIGIVFYVDFAPHLFFAYQARTAATNSRSAGAETPNGSKPRRSAAANSRLAVLSPELIQASQSTSVPPGPCGAPPIKHSSTVS